MDATFELNKYHPCSNNPGCFNKCHRLDIQRLRRPRGAWISASSRRCRNRICRVTVPCESGQRGEASHEKSFQKASVSDKPSRTHPYTTPTSNSSSDPSSSNAMMSFFGLIFNLLGPVLTLAYPAAASFEALHTPDNADNQQWLTYWTIYSSLTALEALAAPIIAWIPFYYTGKMVFVLWMVLPQFRGAHYIFVNVIHPQGQVARQSLFKQFGDQSHLFKGQVVAKKAE